MLLRSVRHTLARHPGRVRFPGACKGEEKTHSRDPTGQGSGLRGMKRLWRIAHGSRLPSFCLPFSRTFCRHSGYGTFDRGTFFRFSPMHSFAHGTKRRFSGMRTFVHGTKSWFSAMDTFGHGTISRFSGMRSFLHGGNSRFSVMRGFGHGRKPGNPVMHTFEQGAGRETHSWPFFDEQKDWRMRISG